MSACPCCGNGRDEYDSDVKLCECGCGAAAPIAKQTCAAKGLVKGQPARFVVGHARRRPIMTKVVKSDGCWAWLGKHYPNGYGSHYLPHQTQQMAHRAVYEHLVGPIPEGLVLDHLCLNRGCVNPSHLEPVTMAENNWRAADLLWGTPRHGSKRMRKRGCQCSICLRHGGAAA